MTENDIRFRRCGDGYEYCDGNCGRCTKANMSASNQTSGEDFFDYWICRRCERFSDCVSWIAYGKSLTPDFSFDVRQCKYHQ